jgi:hypothetical protein
VSRSDQLGTAWGAVEPLISGCVVALAHGDLSPSEQRAERQKTERLIGRVALRHLKREQAVQFLIAADREISRRLDHQAASAIQLPAPRREKPVSSVFDRAAAARSIASPPSVWEQLAAQSLPTATPETRARFARGCHDAAQALRTLGDERWQARGFHWQRLMERAAPPDDDAAVVTGATLGAILQVVPSEAAKLVRHGWTLSAELPDAIERVRRADQRAPQRHKIARGHAPRGAGRERRERPSAHATRAGPDDDDGPSPRAPRPSRSRRRSDLTSRRWRHPRSRRRSR